VKALFKVLGGITLLFLIIGLVPMFTTKRLTGPELSASVKEEVTGPTYARVFAEDALRKNLRDPDSLVIESATPFQLGPYKGKKYYISHVVYRAKNGFGGYNREKAMILLGENLDQRWQFSVLRE
jgi:hypothetical protein